MFPRLKNTLLDLVFLAYCVLNFSILHRIKFHQSLVIYRSIPFLVLLYKIINGGLNTFYCVNINQVFKR